MNRKFAASFAAVALCCVGALSACSSETNSDANNASGGSASTSTNTSQDTIPEKCSNPLEGNPTEVNARELVFCLSDAQARLKGWAQRDVSGDGIVRTNSKVNVKPLAVEVEATKDSPLPNAGVILVEGDTYLNLGDGKWKKASADSTDSLEQQLAFMPQTFEFLINAYARAGATDASLVYKVAGSEEVNGSQTTVLEFELPQEDNGKHYLTKLFVRDDYITMKQELWYDDELLQTTETTEIDAYQRIVKPKLAN